MARDTGLNEITLRKYEKPYSMSKRQLMKKICLSLGLLQPGDSRDIIVDILVILDNAQKEKEKLSSEQIRGKTEEFRRLNNLELKGLAESNVRRQLKRLRDIMIVDKQNNLYNLSEFETLNKIFEEKVEKFIINPSVERIKDYLNELNKSR